jgi:hypothetical protein
MSTSENNDSGHSIAVDQGGSAASVAPAPRPAAVPEQGGNVDKIRDILFGSQMRDYNSRFARLEETLLKESSDLKESVRKRMDALEAHFMKELESLAARLRAERDERVASAKDLSSELKSTSDSLTAAIREAQDGASDADRELRSRLLEQSKTLMDEIQTNRDNVISVLESRFQELRNSKTDRAALAELFTEVALRLNQEFRVPDMES